MNKNTLKHYAKALFSYAEEKDKVTPIGEDLAFVSSVFAQNPELSAFLASPMVEKVKKEDLLAKCFKEHVNIALMGFLNVLIKRKMIKGIQIISDEYQHLLNEKMGILEGRIYSPYPLSQEDLEELSSVFSKKYDKKVVFRTIIDKRALAGMKIYVEDTLYDYSLSSKIDRIKNKLLSQKK